MTAKPTPRHGHAPLPMRRRKGDDAMIEAVGDFYWEGDHLYVAVPDADIGWVVIRLPVVKDVKLPKHWHWDGDREVPTLDPSIHTLGVWHGYIRKGALIEA